MSEVPYEIVDGAAGASTLILCDHASNFVPSEVPGGDLGLPESDMERHIAYDIGARGLGLALAQELQAPAILSRFSRLVIDPNRGDDDPTQVMRLYDGTLIPANARISEDDVARRRAALTEPYHGAISRALDAMGAQAVVISIHTFTPRLAGRPKRPWHVGILYAHDDRLAAPLLASMRSEQGLVVGDNEPYNGALKGDCMDRHCLSRGLKHVLIEVRNDLVEDARSQGIWAKRLAGHLRPLV